MQNTIRPLKHGLAISLFCFAAAACGEGPCPDGSNYIGEDPGRNTAMWCETQMPNGAIVKDGRYITWHTRTQKQTDGQYKNGEKTGKWRTYTATGQIMLSGHFVKGKRHGKWDAWHATDNYYKDKGTWKNGIPHGLWTNFHPNGKIETQGKRKNGPKDGKWTSWYPDGSKKEEGRYTNGKKEGLWKFWSEKTLVEQQRMYENNIEQALPAPPQLNEQDTE